MSTISTGTTITTAFTATGDTTGQFVVQTGASAATAMTIDTSQNVGIGTTSPSSFYSEARNLVVGTGTGGQGMTIYAGTASQSRLMFADGTTGSDPYTGFVQYDHSSNALAFGTNGGTERMRITSGGNVGIGTASPGSFGAGTTCLTVKGSAGDLGRIETQGTSNAGFFQTDSMATYIGSQSNIPFLLFQNNTERMRITSGGNVGIGVDPGAANIRLYVKGANQTASQYTIAAQDGSGNNLFLVENNGALSTGTQASSPYNNTTGSAANMFVTSGGVLQRSTSSLRYKTDITDATHGLADVLKLRSVTYKGKNDGDTVFGGLIAEEVHDAGLTEFVAYDDQGRPDALNYGNMVALLIKSVQELKAENDALKTRIEALESK